MGLLHYFLGLSPSSWRLNISFTKEICQNLLIKYSLLNLKPSATPMNVGENLQLKDRAEMDDAKSFRRMVGRLIHLTHTHPNIAFLGGVISKFMQQPWKINFWAAKRVSYFVTITMENGIWYSQVSNFRLCGFTIVAMLVHCMIDETFQHKFLLLGQE